MADMTCPECDVTLVQVERKVLVSGAGILSVILFFSGIAAFAFHIALGIIVWILAAIVGYGGGKRIVLVCPQCKRDITSLS